MHMVNRQVSTVFGGDPMYHLLCMMIYKANYLPAALIFPNQPALQKDIAAWNREPIGLWWHFLTSCLEIKWLFVHFCVKIPTNFKTSFFKHFGLNGPGLP